VGKVFEVYWRLKMTLKDTLSPVEYAELAEAWVSRPEQRLDILAAPGLSDAAKAIFERLMVLSEKTRLSVPELLTPDQIDGMFAVLEFGEENPWYVADVVKELKTIFQIQPIPGELFDRIENLKAKAVLAKSRTPARPWYDKRRGKYPR